MPTSGISVNGLSGSLLEIVSVAPNGPTFGGAKLTDSVLNAPGARLNGSLATENSADPLVTVSISNNSTPTFSMTSGNACVESSRTDPKSSLPTRR